MEVAEIKAKVPREIMESLSARGLSAFTPPQEAAIGSGLLEGASLVVSAPTASGKTLIAELACAHAIITNGKKAIYIAPMRALVLEKFNDFRQSYPYIRSTVSIGDLDSADEALGTYDMLFVSTEKFDSLLRHGIEWLGRVGCVVFDEVHMIDDQSRGPTLEVLATKLLEMHSMQIIALSATVSNSKELAEWLGARLVQSSWRPVPLKKGIVFEGKVYSAVDGEYETEDLRGESGEQESRVVEDTMSRGKQTLVFYSTKRNAEAGAERLARVIEGRLTPEEKRALEGIGEGVLKALDRPTEQCMKLSRLVKRGVAFHHSGLVNAQRAAIEEAFRANRIKAICSTSTLGVGINLPAHTVLVKETRRFDGAGSTMIGVNTMLQLFGRAGRPKYDTEGRALLIAQRRDSIDMLYDKYISAEAEEVESKLGIVPVLRTHVLAFIAEGFLNSVDGIQGFLLKTFYGFSYGDTQRLRRLVKQILDELILFGFVDEEERSVYAPTRIGKRVSELYIDPLSARAMLDGMEVKEDALDTLFMICNTLEMRPHARVTEEAEAIYAARRHMRLGGSLDEKMEAAGSGYYDPLAVFSTALLLNDWINELGEQEIVSKYRTTPGEVFSKVNRADWMIYSAIELAKLAHISVHDMIDLRVRLKSGIKEELLDLVRLEQVGRMRARVLFDNGIRTVAELRDSRDAAERLLGKGVASRIFEQLQ